MEPFVESGMTFGPYDDGMCFRLETSNTYRAIQDGVKIAEMWLLRPNGDSRQTIWIVEAKKSSPMPERKNFPEFVGDISDKLTNSLVLYVSMMLGRHETRQAELPGPFKTINLSTSQFRLILVINGHDIEWLPPLQDELRLRLKSTSQLWNLGANAVVVLNHDMALRHGLISAIES